MIKENNRETLNNHITKLYHKTLWDLLPAVTMDDMQQVNDKCWEIIAAKNRLAMSIKYIRDEPEKEKIDRVRHAIIDLEILEELLGTANLPSVKDILG